MARERWFAGRSATARVAARLERALAPPVRTYMAWFVEGHRVGWIIPERVPRLIARPDVFRRAERGVELVPALATDAARTAAVAEIARALSAEGALTAWRDERYAVAADATRAPLLELERAAARYFGIHTFASHANGVVASGDGWRMWLARRSPTKAIDPGLLDNLVGGGIPARAGPRETLVKEAFEEAGIPAGLARDARGAGTLDVCRDQPEGLQWETMHVYDLWLPSGFAPQNQDGEAVEHRLCAPQELVSILEGDDITADASLVAVDFLLRHGHIEPGDPSLESLDRLRHPEAMPRE
ncbi:MAG TPA: DUF4743 domain-containing protein [Casimicrobiaceae bacterium]|nr:DUF4743 domain-containing protein [Casimicrobiaceae bacterium]